MLPHNGLLYTSNELTPDIVQQLNDENQEWMESQSKERCMKRCRGYEHELMHHFWNPDHVMKMKEMGHAIIDTYKYFNHS